MDHEYEYITMYIYSDQVWHEKMKIWAGMLGRDI